MLIGLFLKNLCPIVCPIAMYRKGGKNAESGKRKSPVIL